MTKTEGPPRPWTRVIPGGIGVDVVAAADFLRGQCASLLGVLRWPPSPTDVSSVLDRHDASHAQWVDLIAAVERCWGRERAGQLATVYMCYGRIVGVLECRLHQLLPDEAAAELHSTLATYLRQMTDRAIGDLTGMPGVWPASPEETLQPDDWTVPGKPMSS